MKRFEISLTPEAQRDASMLRYAIIFKYRAPLTAKRYLEGLNKKMKLLEVGADSIQIDAEQTERYGFEIRRINYKEMAILYSIESEKVLVQQITPQNLVY